MALDGPTLRAAPRLKAVGRLSAGVESIDRDACSAAGVEVVRANSAVAAAEAEFALCAMLQMLRRVPILAAEGMLVGRELGACTVGLVGMTPAAKPLAEMLTVFGARVIGYDPGTHPSDPLWTRHRVLPSPLPELMATSDVVCVMLPFYARYEGLIGDEAAFASSPISRTSCSLPRATSRACPSRSRPASPHTSSGTRWAGERFISERSTRQAETRALSCAIQPSAAASTRSSCARGWMQPQTAGWRSSRLWSLPAACCARR